MTVDQLEMLGLPVEVNEETVLYINAGLEWISANTTLKVDKENMESIKALPDGAKLFLCKYFEIMGVSVNVTSESIGGMSQSFTDKSKDMALWQTASGLLSGYLLSQVQSVPNVSKWR